VGEVVVMRQGDIWFGQTPSEKGRPYLVLTRNEAIGLLNTVLVAPVTRSVRGIPTEIPLGPDNGLREECAATLDNSIAIRRAYLTAHLGSLDSGRWPEVCAAMRAAIDC
jgi:mRNA interferase MazF